MCVTDGVVKPWSPRVICATVGILMVRSEDEDLDCGRLSRSTLSLRVAIATAESGKTGSGCMAWHGVALEC